MISSRERKKSYQIALVNLKNTFLPEFSPLLQPSSPLKQTSEVVWCGLMIKELNSILGIQG
jgi:hypothetical protein